MRTVLFALVAAFVLITSGKGEEPKVLPPLLPVPKGEETDDNKRVPGNEPAKSKPEGKPEYLPPLVPKEEPKVNAADLPKDEKKEEMPEVQVLRHVEFTEVMLSAKFNVTLKGDTTQARLHQFSKDGGYNLRLLPRPVTIKQRFDADDMINVVVTITKEDDVMIEVPTRTTFSMGWWHNIKEEMQRKERMKKFLQEK